MRAMQTEQEAKGDIVLIDKSRMSPFAISTTEPAD